MSVDRIATALQQDGAAVVAGETLADVVEAVQLVGLDPREVRVDRSIHLIKPEDCAKPCEDCAGFGERILNQCWPAGELPYSEKCSTCGGTGVRNG